MSDKKYMRDRAICILELFDAFATEPYNAEGAMLEMARYVLDLTTRSEPVFDPTIQEVEAEMINKSIEFAGEESEDRMTFRSGFWSCYNYLKKYESTGGRWANNGDILEFIFRVFLRASGAEPAKSIEEQLIDYKKSKA